MTTQKIKTKWLETQGFEKLTAKQARWLAEFYRTGNATEAAAIAYNCKDRAGASQIGWENKKRFSEPIGKLAESMGIDIKFILRGFKEAARATKIHSSHTEPDSRVPDWQARIRALGELAELMGLKVETQKGMEQTISVVVDKELLDATKRRIEELKK